MEIERENDCQVFFYIFTCKGVWLSNFEPKSNKTLRKAPHLGDGLLRRKLFAVTVTYARFKNASFIL